MASSRDPKHQNRNFSDAKRHSRGAIALKLFARSPDLLLDEAAAPERRQLERTLGRIALTAIDIGGIFSLIEAAAAGQTLEFLRWRYRSITEENLRGFVGDMVARLQKESQRVDCA